MSVQDLSSDPELDVEVGFKFGSRIDRRDRMSGSDSDSEVGYQIGSQGRVSIRKSSPESGVRVRY